jgi:Dolichyl-phosphate-mannose-protein mannosyltransferase
MRSSSLGSKLSSVEICLLILVIGGGVALRVSDLEAYPFWVDEAESAINALTILQHGYPTDTYLGLPIFENTLIQPWPDNPEYEFRDISYSNRHMAVYHGWLPLYAIAASFAISHVRPDAPAPAPSIRHDLSERKRLTRAARIPSVLFGAGFLALVFVGGNLLYGRDAAWTALICGSLHPWHIGLSRQARYYSAQVWLTTACCILVWLMIKRAEWKHFLFAGLGFVLLFHTHLLSFLTAVMVVAFTAPLIFKQRRAVAKIVSFGLIVAGGTLPWLILTGFLTHQAQIPRAWALLRLPADLTEFPPVQITNLFLGAIFVAAAAWALLAGERASSRLRKPLLESVPSLSLIAIWVGCGYTAFLVLVPAASFDDTRLNLSYWGPTLIGASVLCSASARIITGRRSALAAPVLGLLLLVILGYSSQLRTHRDLGGGSWTANEQLIDWLGAMHLQEDTKIYATPNGHLILTVYTGLPVQSILPVRKQFLNSYRGEIVYIDSPVSVDWNVLRREQVENAAVRDGIPPDSAGQWLWLLRTRQYREAMLNNVGPGESVQLASLPRFATTLLSASRKEIQAAFARSSLRLMTRGFEIQNWQDWCAVLDYRFVNPELRRGANSNYRERLRGTEGVILTGADTVIYRSRWQAERRGGIQFRFEPQIRCEVLHLDDASASCSAN